VRGQGQDGGIHLEPDLQAPAEARSDAFPIFPLEDHLEYAKIQPLLIKKPTNKKELAQFLKMKKEGDQQYLIHHFAPGEGLAMTEDDWYVGQVETYFQDGPWINFARDTSAVKCKCLISEYGKNWHLLKEDPGLEAERHRGVTQHMMPHAEVMMIMR
jgi:hypothetical protein